MTLLNVVASIPVKPEAADEVRAALQTLVAATRQEEGCVSYDLYESAGAPGTFVTLERWTDAAALDAHMGMPHVADAFAAAGDALSGEVLIHSLHPVDVT